MLDYNPVTKESGSCIITGRGAIAIRLALSAISAKKGYVILPANICYAAVLPVIYAGYTPAFCDVDASSGNVTFGTVEAALKKDVIAAVIPHMYGNPVKDFLQIAELLRSKNIVLIEDCASLMAQEGKEYIPGTIGDYVVYSTGYSKSIDIGIGGLLFSKSENLSGLELIERGYPPFRTEYKTIWGDFSKTYRVLRDEGQDTEKGKKVFLELPDRFKESFSFSVDDVTRKKIIDSLTKLRIINKERRRQFSVYQELLELPTNMRYPFSCDAIPWRYNMFVRDNRKSFIDYCLEHKLPISDWYPLVTSIFGCNGSFPGAEEHEKQIINFPLMVSDDRIRKICNLISLYIRG